MTGTGTTILRGQRFTRTERNGTSEHMIVDRDLWLGVLANTFHVDLSTATSEAIERMWERAVAASSVTTADIEGAIRT